MNAAALAFRFRVFIFLLLYLFGFLPPWNFRSGSRGTLWLGASALLARSGWIGLAAGTLVVTLLALGCLVLGTILRVWGTAYLGSGVMSGFAMHGDELVAGGPYRYVRNPLYLGAGLLALGVSILMPPSGAAFFLSAFSIFVLILISVEEHFLRQKLGSIYQQYCRQVPRLVPRLASRDLQRSGSPRWMQAVFAETYSLALTICFAIFAWRYNARILIQCMLICYGLSLIMRALSTRTAKGGLPGET
jgi:protein-S-isoprenylcysteine O-methyltransferase Ste14